MAEITGTPVEHARDALNRYYRHGITQNAVDVDYDARELVIDLGHLIERNAPAATSSDNLGRQLAQIVRLAERVRDRQSSVDVRDQVDDLLGALRSLAAPGGAKAGDFAEVDTPPADTRPDAVLATALGRVGAAATVDEALSLCDRVTLELDRFDMVVAARPDLAINVPGTGTSAADRRRVYAAVRDLLDEDDHGLPPGVSDAAIRLTSRAMRRALHEPTVISRTETEAGDRAELRRVLDALADVDCTFWACRGPDVPHQDMETCRVCALIQDVRAALAATPPPAEGEAGDRGYLVDFIGGPRDRWHRWAGRSDAQATGEVVGMLLPRVHAVRVHRGECGGVEPNAERSVPADRQTEGTSGTAGGDHRA